MILMEIKYINGEQEKLCVDDAWKEEGWLKYYIRFGVRKGIYSVPSSNIRRWRACR